MKKTVVVMQTIILVLLFVILGRSLWFEEIFILAILSVLIAFLICGAVSLVLRIQKKAKFRKVFGISLIGASGLQLFLCLFFVWSLYPRVMGKEEVLADINHGLTVMEEIHPDLYASVDKAQLAAPTSQCANPARAKRSNLPIQAIFRLSAASHSLGKVRRSHSQLHIRLAGQHVFLAQQGFHGGS